jgi:hypothetical protein
MTNPFEAAISLLAQGVGGQLENAKHWDDNQEFGAANARRNMARKYEAAIRVLEVAGELTGNDKKWLLSKVDWAIAEYAPAIKGMVCPGKDMKDRFRVLLYALPDKEKGCL